MTPYERALALMQGDAPDHKQALAYLERAVSAQDSRAEYALSTWYMNGLHVRKDPQRAVSLLRKAARSEEPDALFNLAALHERGRYVKKNPGQAFDLYKRAAEAGDRGAMAEVGRMLYYGIGTIEDRTAADYWLARSEEGSASANEGRLQFVY